MSSKIRGRGAQPMRTGPMVDAMRVGDVLKIRCIKKVLSLTLYYAIIKIQAIKMSIITA